MFEEGLMIKRYQVIISGRVIGVFFRRFIYDNALKLNLKGYVKNINDKVEVVLEGEEENINKLIQLCKKGPPSARVVNIEVIEEKIKNEKTFRVIR